MHNFSPLSINEREEFVKAAQEKIAHIYNWDTLRFLQHHTLRNSENKKRFMSAKWASILFSLLAFVCALVLCIYGISVSGAEELHTLGKIGVILLLVTIPISAYISLKFEAFRAHLLDEQEYYVHAATRKVRKTPPQKTAVLQQLDDIKVDIEKIVGAPRVQTCVLECLDQIKQTITSDFENQTYQATGRRQAEFLREFLPTLSHSHGMSQKEQDDLILKIKDQFQAENIDLAHEDRLQSQIA